MFENGVIEEVRAADGMSETASKMIGLREIRELLAGRCRSCPPVDRLVPWRAMRGRDSTSDPALRQKAVDLVSAAN